MGAARRRKSRRYRRRRSAAEVGPGRNDPAVRALTGKVSGFHRIGFTSTRDLPDFARFEILVTLVNLEADEFVTAAARGADSLIGRALARRYPDARHRVIVPANRAQIDPWWLVEPSLPAHFQIDLMPPTTTYRDRNLALVRSIDELIGYPLYAEDDVRSRRSGTWQTIRLARKAHLLVSVHILDQLR